MWFKADYKPDPPPPPITVPTGLDGEGSLRHGLSPDLGQGSPSVSQRPKEKNGTRLTTTVDVLY